MCGFLYSKCGPRLSQSAAEKLQNRYVLMRNGAGAHERETGRRTSIPITVRQLEAIIRIAESLAKMRLAPFATEADVDEALRLFQVSTLDAASTGNLAGLYFEIQLHHSPGSCVIIRKCNHSLSLLRVTGAEGFTTEEDQEMLARIEKQVKRRFVIGSQVSEHAIVQDFLKQVRCQTHSSGFNHTQRLNVAGMLSEIPGARHLQSCSSDVATRRAAAQNAAQDALPRQVSLARQLPSPVFDLHSCSIRSSQTIPPLVQWFTQSHSNVP